jgi:hypothetical protein
MHRRTMVGALQVLLVVGMIVAGLGRTKLAIAADGNPSASGQGSRTVDGERRTLSFTAVQHEDGPAMGQAQVVNQSLGLVAHIEIVCLNIIGNRAYVGGFVTQSNLPSFTVPGDTAVFAGEDNGEGAKAPPDRITLTGFGIFAQPDCFNSEIVGILNSLLLPIEAGNIQVNP